MYIGKTEYQRAKKTVEEYETFHAKSLIAYNQNKKMAGNVDEETSQLALFTAEKGEYVTYLGGLKSTNLVKGRSYRLTSSAFNCRLPIINETGKRMVYKRFYFKLNP